MRAYEIINESILDPNQLDEGFRDWAAAGILGLGALGHTSTAQPAADIPNKPMMFKAPVVQFKPISDNPQIEKALHAIAKQSGIVGTELAQFLAQIKHESWDFSKMVEKASGKKYDKKHSPQLAKSLGNTKPGDGERYKGRGFIGLTGKYNYDQAGKALDLPLVKQPELAARPDIAAKIAVWYWKTRVQPYVKDFSNTQEVTKKINPNLKGLLSRNQNFQEYRKLVR